jgi:hypothetical protein
MVDLQGYVIPSFSRDDDRTSPLAVPAGSGFKVTSDVNRGAPTFVQTPGVPRLWTEELERAIRLRLAAPGATTSWRVCDNRGLEIQDVGVATDDEG